MFGMGTGVAPPPSSLDKNLLANFGVGQFYVVKLISLIANSLPQVQCLLDLLPNLMSADICFAKSLLYPENRI